MLARPTDQRSPSPAATRGGCSAASVLLIAAMSVILGLDVLPAQPSSSWASPRRRSSRRRGPPVYTSEVLTEQARGTPRAPPSSRSTTTLPRPRRPSPPSRPGRSSSRRRLGRRGLRPGVSPTRPAAILAGALRRPHVRRPRRRSWRSTAGALDGRPRPRPRGCWTPSSAPSCATAELPLVRRTWATGSRAASRPTSRRSPPRWSRPLLVANSSYSDQLTEQARAAAAADVQPVQQSLAAGRDHRRQRRPGRRRRLRGDHLLRPQPGRARRRAADRLLRPLGPRRRACCCSGRGGSAASSGTATTCSCCSACSCWSRCSRSSSRPAATGCRTRCRWRAVGMLVTVLLDGGRGAGPDRADRDPRRGRERRRMAAAWSWRPTSCWAASPASSPCGAATGCRCSCRRAWPCSSSRPLVVVIFALLGDQDIRGVLRADRRVGGVGRRRGGRDRGLVRGRSGSVFGIVTVFQLLELANPSPAAAAAAARRDARHLPPLADGGQPGRARRRGDRRRPAARPRRRVLPRRRQALEPGRVHREPGGRRQHPRRARPRDVRAAAQEPRRRRASTSPTSPGCPRRSSRSSRSTTAPAVMSYFYARAREQAAAPYGGLETAEGRKAADAVDIRKFRHGGPKPQSREAAIIMLADSVEASVRSLSSRDEAAIRAMVARIFEERIGDDQFDECDLTLRDIERIREAFVGAAAGHVPPAGRVPAEQGRRARVAARCQRRGLTPAPERIGASRHRVVRRGLTRARRTITMRRWSCGASRAFWAPLIRGRAMRSVVRRLVAVMSAGLLISLVAVPSLSAAAPTWSHRDVNVCGPASAGTAACDSVARVLYQNGSQFLATSPGDLGRIAKPAASVSYTAVGIRTAYGITGTGDPSHVIAIVDAYDDTNAYSHLSTYRSSMGLAGIGNCSLSKLTGLSSSSPAPCFAKVNQTGGTSLPSANSGWATEERPRPPGGVGGVPDVQHRAVRGLERVVREPRDRCHHRVEHSARARHLQQLLSAATPRAPATRPGTMRPRRAWRSWPPPATAATASGSRPRPRMCSAWVAPTSRLTRTASARPRPRGPAPAAAAPPTTPRRRGRS